MPTKSTIYASHMLFFLVLDSDQMHGRNEFPPQNVYYSLHLTTTTGCPPANNLSSYTIVGSQKCISIVYINATMIIVSSIPFNCIYIIEPQ